MTDNSKEIRKKCLRQWKDTSVLLDKDREIRLGRYECLDRSATTVSRICNRRRHPASDKLAFNKLSCFAITPIGEAVQTSVVVQLVGSSYFFFFICGVLSNWMDVK